MRRDELRTMSGGVVGEARQVLDAFTLNRPMAGIPLNDPSRSAQSFGGDRGAETFWYTLICLHSFTRRLTERRPDALPDLQCQLRYVEELLPQL